MKKEKATLKDLKLNSFVTSLEGEQLENVKGGFIKVQGRRYTYNIRWTSVDTRAEPQAKSVDSSGK